MDEKLFLLFGVAVLAVVGVVVVLVLLFGTGADRGPRDD
jgi:hypothetical protein